MTHQISAFVEKLKLHCPIKLFTCLEKKTVRLLICLNQRTLRFNDSNKKVFAE